MMKSNVKNPFPGALKRVASYQGQFKKDRANYQELVKQFKVPSPPDLPAAPKAAPAFDPAKEQMNFSEAKHAGAAALITALVGTLIYKGNGYLAGAYFGGAMKMLQIGEHQRAQDYLDQYRLQIEDAALKQRNYDENIRSIMANRALDFRERVDAIKLAAGAMGDAAVGEKLALGQYSEAQKILETRAKAVADANKTAALATQHTTKNFVAMVGQTMGRTQHHIDALNKQLVEVRKKGVPDLPMISGAGGQLVSSQGFVTNGKLNGQLALNEVEAGIAAAKKGGGGIRAQQQAAEEISSSIDGYFKEIKTLTSRIYILEAKQKSLSLMGQKSAISGKVPQYFYPGIGPVNTTPTPGKEAPQTSIGELDANPSYAESFYLHFGYLPLEFIKANSPSTN